MPVKLIICLAFLASTAMPQQLMRVVRRNSAPPALIGPVDFFVNLAGTTAGTTLTTGILNAGTVGNGNHAGWAITGTGLTAAATNANCTLGGSLQVNGTVYPTPQTTLSMAVDNSGTLRYITASIPNPAYTQVTILACVTIGAATVSGVMDLIRVDGATSGNQIAQVSQTKCGGTLGIDLEVINGGTTNTSCITVTTGNSYWLVLQSDYVAGTAKLDVYDATYAKIGSTLSASQASGQTFASVKIGNVESGTSTGSNTFENIMVRYSGGSPFPMGPVNTTQPTVYLVSKSATNAAAATTTIQSPATDLKAGATNLVFVSGETAARTVTGCTDTAGNTYVTDATLRASLASNCAVEAWYAKNTTANSANQVTCTWSGTQDFRTIQALQIAGGSTSAPFDVGQNGTVASGNATVTTGTFTPTVATGSAFIGGHITSGTRMTSGTNYLGIYADTNSYSTSVRYATAASGQTASLTSSSTASKCAVVANIKP